MTKDVFGKHMVWTEHPTTKNQIGIGYSSLTEAEAEAVKLEQAGYKILADLAHHPAQAQLLIDPSGHRREVPAWSDLDWLHRDLCRRAEPCPKSGDGRLEAAPGRAIPAGRRREVPVVGDRDGQSGDRPFDVDPEGSFRMRGALAFPHRAGADHDGERHDRGRDDRSSDHDAGAGRVRRDGGRHGASSSPARTRRA